MSVFMKTERFAGETLPVLCRTACYEQYDGFPKHFHDSVEIIICTSGELKCTADNRTYNLKCGDILVFNPYTVHSVYSIEENTVHLCLTFSLIDVMGFHNTAMESCVDLLLSGHYLFDEYYPAAQEGSDVLLRHIMRLYENVKIKNQISEAIVLSELYSILSLLFETHYHAASAKLQPKRSRQFMQKFSAYLLKNYNKPITTGDAAQALYMSASRFSYLFKQYFGVNFTKYLRQYRIELTIQNYADFTGTIKEIAESVGFTDYCYFSHAFKEYTGFSPSAYFKNRKISSKGAVIK